MIAQNNLLTNYTRGKIRFFILCKNGYQGCSKHTEIRDVYASKLTSRRHTPTLDIIVLRHYSAVPSKNAVSSNINKADTSIKCQCGKGLYVHADMLDLVNTAFSYGRALIVS